MLKTGIKSIQLEDFDEVKEEVDQLAWLTKEFRIQIPKTRIDATDTLGHPMKTWEWARALRVIKQLDLNSMILSIGSAYCPLEIALAYLGYIVYEGDVDAGCGEERKKVNAFLQKFNGNPTQWHQVGFGGLHEHPVLRLSEDGRLDKWDVVMSISTIEHIDLWLEKAAWKEMAELTKPGGVLIVTMDGFPESRKGFMYDDVRWTNYGPDLIKDRVKELKSYGFKPIGGEDYTYHGNQVNDYSFWSIHMKKEK